MRNRFKLNRRQKWKRKIKENKKIFFYSLFCFFRIKKVIYFVLDLKIWENENRNEKLHQNKSEFSLFRSFFLVHFVHMIIHVKLKCKKQTNSHFLIRKITSFFLHLSDRKANVGTIECRMCQETYSTSTHCKRLLFCFHLTWCFLSVDLTEPVDVYNSWIDACEEQNRE